ncbi:AAA family ATPase [Shewanella sp. SM29]|nr:AAA family ATPase [Shewanella sp. SM29]MCU8075662.1 AAA family ATPase [Shewanella sp. SM29]
MRLSRIQLVGHYKSIKGTLESPFIYHFKESEGSDSPLCLVGLNGSGKSNFIELIADIFGYADRYFNPQYKCKKDLDYDFILDYQIMFEGRTVFVKLASNASKLKLYCYDNSEYIDFLSFGNRQENRCEAMVGLNLVELEHRHFLPANVVAYSSGHNQGLSSVFAKTELQYFDVIRKQGVFYREYKPRYDKVMEEQDAENDDVWQVLSKYVNNTYKQNESLFSVPRAYQDDLDSYFRFPEEPLQANESNLPIGLYTDHSLSNVFFIYLMSCRGVNKAKSETFRQFLSENVNIDDICSFDIDLRLTEYKEFETIGNIVRRLTELSCESQGISNPRVDEEINYSPKLHFKVGETFSKAMERLYLDETVFLEHLFTLHHLTARRWSHDEKRTLKSSKYERNVPSVSGGLMPMRILNVEVKLKSPNVTTLYDRLSDGEHQLIQILGSLMLFDHQQTLFILDEPESHFNPEWRIEFIDIISKYVNLSNLELMISTHSPFVLSACKAERVLHFEKDGVGNVSIIPLEVETYGASFDSLLTSVFDLDVLISKRPLIEIRAGLRAYDEGLMDENETLQRLKPFGDSFELNLRRNQILRKTTPKIRGTD